MFCSPSFAVLPSYPAAPWILGIDSTTVSPPGRRHDARAAPACSGASRHNRQKTHGAPCAPRFPSRLRSLSPNAAHPHVQGRRAVRAAAQEQPQTGRPQTPPAPAGRGGDGKRPDSGIQPRPAGGAAPPSPLHPTHPPATAPRAMLFPTMESPVCRPRRIITIGTIVRQSRFPAACPGAPPAARPAVL